MALTECDHDIAHWVASQALGTDGWVREALALLEEAVEENKPSEHSVIIGDYTQMAFALAMGRFAFETSHTCLIDFPARALNTSHTWLVTSGSAKWAPMEQPIREPDAFRSCWV